MTTPPETDTLNGAQSWAFTRKDGPVHVSNRVFIRQTASATIEWGVHVDGTTARETVRRVDAALNPPELWVNPHAAWLLRKTHG